MMGVFNKDTKDNSLRVICQSILCLSLLVTHWVISKGSYTFFLADVFKSAVTEGLKHQFSRWEYVPLICLEKINQSWAKSKYVLAPGQNSTNVIINLKLIYFNHWIKVTNFYFQQRFTVRLGHVRNWSVYTTFQMVGLHRFITLNAVMSI